MAKREKVRQSISQINITNKIQVAFVGTAQDGEVDETPPMLESSLENRSIRRRRQNLDMRADLIQPID